jgi:predicted aldo/keto reductase-like oxidoreductase
VHGALTPTEAFSYAMSIPGVSTTISGVDSMGVLDQNLNILRRFQPLGEKQLTELREHASVRELRSQSGKGSTAAENRH